MTDCNQCTTGCCNYHNGKRWVRCRYMRVKNGKSYCSVYPIRIGKVMGVHKDGSRLTCNMRSSAPVNYLGCPQNKVGQPFISAEMYSAKWRTKHLNKC